MSIQNSIWGIKRGDGVVVKGQEDIESKAIKQFHNLYLDPRNNTIIKQTELIQNFLGYFYMQEGSMADLPMMLEKIETVLKGFSKSNILGLDGWTGDGL